jgi:hypothetical protein
VGEGLLSMLFMYLSLGLESSDFFPAAIESERSISPKRRLRAILTDAHNVVPLSYIIWIAHAFNVVDSLLIAECWQ